MPRLWSETIENHRHAVQEAVLDATAEIVRARGITGVTMSLIAESIGIGRATLYKYFPDIESVLLAWHRREAARHLSELARARESAPPGRRLADVMEAYALSLHGRAHGEIAAWLHRDAGLDPAQAELVGVFRELIAEAVAGGTVRSDAAPSELAEYCLHALAAARSMHSAAAARRLAAITRDGLRPSHGAHDGHPAPR